MPYAIVEFEEDCAVSIIVHSNWITPRKKVFWPPFKEQTKFDKALNQGAEVDPDGWALYAVKRVLYETDNYERAREKWKQSENTSNLETDLDESEPKRQRQKPASRFPDSCSDEEGEVVNFPRPPPVLRKKYKRASEIQSSQTLFKKELLAHGS